MPGTHARIPQSLRLRHTGASILSGTDSVRSSRTGSRAGDVLKKMMTMMTMVIAVVVGLGYLIMSWMVVNMMVLAMMIATRFLELSWRFAISDLAVLS